MATMIEFREIPIFRHFEAEARQHLSQIFQSLTKLEGEQILTYGKPVPGIFIIVEGEVVVTAPNIDQHLARLGRGQSFGEMSLIEQVESASANIVVASPEVKLMFGSADAIKKLLLILPGCAYAFYKGAAMLLSSRLRNVNTRINEEIAQGHGLVTGLIRQSEMSQQLTVARSEVDRTGNNVVGKLMTVMPIIDTLLAKYPTAKTDLEELRKKIEEVFLVDSQNFDRISQQLDLIVQHFDNLKRVANGGMTIGLYGDQNLFKKAGGA